MVVSTRENPPQTSVSIGADAIKVMVVDDSAVIRGLITRMLEADPAITVIASASNGQIAIKELARHDVDVIILDIEMPVMDGMTALPKFFGVDPDVQVLMASTLTLQNAEISMRALAAGAADYVPKPSATRDISGGDMFRQELLAKVKALGTVRRQTDRRGRAQRPAVATIPGEVPSAPTTVTLRQAGTNPPDIVAIGSSTGGPQALFALLKDISARVRQPILITQHMPATFTTILAQHIGRNTGWPCKEATDGDIIAPGNIYLAPGNYHMVAQFNGPQRVVRLNQDPPENYCRPSVDVMLKSLPRTFGDRVLAVILTGMGQDGLEGGKIVAKAGGTIVAQDEKTSVVWGMPRAVAVAGLCSAVLPLQELGAYIAKFASRGAS